MLARFRISNEELKKAILTLNEAVLSAESVEVGVNDYKPEHARINLSQTESTGLCAYT